MKRVLLKETSLMRIAIRILNTSTNSEHFAGHDGLIGAIPPTAVDTSIFCTSSRSCSSFGGEAMCFNILQKMMFLPC